MLAEKRKWLRNKRKKRRECTDVVASPRPAPHRFYTAVTNPPRHVLALFPFYYPFAVFELAEPLPRYKLPRLLPPDIIQHIKRTVLHLLCFSSNVIGLLHFYDSDYNLAVLVAATFNSPPFGAFFDGLYIFLPAHVWPYVREAYFLIACVSYENTLPWARILLWLSGRVPWWGVALSVLAPKVTMTLAILAMWRFAGSSLSLNPLTWVYSAYVMSFLMGQSSPGFILYFYARNFTERPVGPKFAMGVTTLAAAAWIYATSSQFSETK